MNLLLVFLGYTLITGYLTSTANGLQCLECPDMPHPEDCRVTTTCSGSSKCYVEQVVSSGGLVLHNMGCTSESRCTSKRSFGQRSFGRKRISKRKDTISSTDIVTCIECCDGDFCNIEGCGQKATKQPQRPPLCFTCPFQRDPNSCRDVKLCDQEHMCALQQKIPYNGEWKSECVPRRQCQAFAQVSLMNSGRPCYSCCQEDFCNNICNLHERTTTTSLAPASATTHILMPVLTSTENPTVTIVTPTKRSTDNAISTLSIVLTSSTLNTNTIGTPISTTISKSAPPSFATTSVSVPDKTTKVPPTSRVDTTKPMPSTHKWNIITSYPHSTDITKISKTSTAKSNISSSHAVGTSTESLTSITKSVPSSIVTTSVSVPDKTTKASSTSRLDTTKPMTSTHKANTTTSYPHSTDSTNISKTSTANPNISSSHAMSAPTESLTYITKSVPSSILTTSVSVPDKTTKASSTSGVVTTKPMTSTHKSNIITSYPHSTDSTNISKTSTAKSNISSSQLTSTGNSIVTMVTPTEHSTDNANSTRSTVLTSSTFNINTTVTPKSTTISKSVSSSIVTASVVVPDKTTKASSTSRVDTTKPMTSAHKLNITSSYPHSTDSTNISKTSTAKSNISSSHAVGTLTESPTSITKLVPSSIVTASVHVPDTTTKVSSTSGMDTTKPMTSTHKPVTLPKENSTANNTALTFGPPPVTQHSVQTTQVSIITTTAKPPYTIPPKAVMCAVCSGPDFLCEKLYEIKQCVPPNNYCVNKLENHKDGTRKVTRGCAEFQTCYRDWFLGSSDSDKCRNFEQNNIVTLEYQCTYCCIHDNCSVPIKPADASLYRDL